MNDTQANPLTPYGALAELARCQAVAARLGLAAWAGLAATTLEFARTAAAAVDPDSTAAMAPTGARLTIGDIYERMKAAGYRGITEIEWEDGYYEVEARDAHDREVELHVDGSTGAVIRTLAAEDGK